MKDKKHVWLDIAVVGVVLAQIMLCVAPRRSTPLVLSEADLSKLTPGHSVEINIPGQTVKVEIPQGEAADSGTFSLIPSRGTPILGIRRDGVLQGLKPGRMANGATELIITMKGRGAAHEVTSVIFQSSGFNFAPRKTPSVPQINPGSTNELSMPKSNSNVGQFSPPVKEMPAISTFKRAKTVDKAAL